MAMTISSPYRSPNLNLPANVRRDLSPPRGDCDLTLAKNGR